MFVPACPTCGTWLASGIPKVPVGGTPMIHPCSPRVFLDGLLLRVLEGRSAHSDSIDDPVPCSSRFVGVSSMDD
jgi:hypothetical protein